MHQGKKSLHATAEWSGASAGQSLSTAEGGGVPVSVSMTEHVEPILHLLSNLSLLWCFPLPSQNSREAAPYNKRVLILISSCLHSLLDGLCAPIQDLQQTSSPAVQCGDTVCNSAKNMSPVKQNLLLSLQTTRSWCLDHWILSRMGMRIAQKTQQTGIR